jgi:hypothetical protein
MKKVYRQADVTADKGKDMTQLPQSELFVCF